MRYLKVFSAILCCLFISCTSPDRQLFKELEPLAENGNPEAQYHLGMMYNNGLGVAKDPRKAFEWFAKAESSGDPLGAYKIGCYYGGQFIGTWEVDPEKSLQYKLIAAEAGYVRAQTEVAAKYYEKKEFDKAIIWWKRAANQGNPDSVYNLAAIYYKGKDVPRDSMLAYKYLKIIERKAGEQKSHEIQTELKELEGELSKVQIEEAQLFANNYNPMQTELTIKAYDGIKESRRIVEKAKNKQI